MQPCNLVSSEVLHGGLEGLREAIREDFRREIWEALESWAASCTVAGPRKAARDSLDADALRHAGCAQAMEAMAPSLQLRRRSNADPTPPARELRLRGPTTPPPQHEGLAETLPGCCCSSVASLHPSSSRTPEAVEGRVDSDDGGSAPLGFEAQKSRIREARLQRGRSMMQLSRSWTMDGRPRSANQCHKLQRAAMPGCGMLESAFKKLIFRRTSANQNVPWYIDGLDFVVSVSIILNGLFFGLQADYMALHCTEAVPLSFGVFEMIFCVIFTLELVVKLCRHRTSFYTMEGWKWNVFDTLLVAMQLGDVLMELLFGGNNAALGTAAAIKNFTLIRLLRMLRLLRILRLVRLLHFFSELNGVTIAIYSSLKSLCGTALMLLLVMYIVGVVLTQVVTIHRVELAKSGAAQVANLEYWWGGLWRSVLSLYEAILGGVDWDDVVAPLIPISYWLAVAFAMYIALVVLAMMNVITGIFVEHALKNAEKEKDRVVTNHIWDVYNALGVKKNGDVLRSEFLSTMEDEEIQAYFREMGVDASEASHLFDFLDADGIDRISAEELVEGLVRLREGAKYLDMITLLYEMDQQTHTISDWMERTNESIATIMEHLEGVRTKEEQES